MATIDIDELAGIIRDVASKSIAIPITQYYPILDKKDEYYIDTIKQLCIVNTTDKYKLNSLNVLSNFKNIIKQPESKYNYGFKNPTLANGEVDCLQIYIAHAVDPDSSIIAFNIKLYNATKFAINKVKIEAHWSSTLEPMEETCWAVDVINSLQFYECTLSAKYLHFGKTMITCKASLEDKFTIESSEYVIPYIDILNVVESNPLWDIIRGSHFGSFRFKLANK